MAEQKPARESRGRGPFSSIKSKFLLYGLCVALIPITIDATLYYFNARRLLKRQIQEEMAAVAEAKKAHILEFMEAKKGRTVDFSSDGFIRDSLEKINLVESPEQANVAALNKHLTLNKKPLDPDIMTIAVVDPNGRVAASTNEKIIGKDVSSHEQFKQTIDKTANKPYVGKIRQSPILERNGIFVSVPITTQTGADTIGVLVIAYDLAILSKIMSGGTELGETGEVYLVNSDGLMLTESRFIEGAPLKQTVDTEPVRKMVESGGHMTGIYPNYRAVPVVGASACIPEYGWTLLAETDKSKAFAPLKTLGIIALAIWLITAAATAGVGFVFASSQSQPIKRLTDAARSLAAGNLEHRVKIDRRDEIGELARSFNAMADELSKEAYKLALAVEQGPSIVTITDINGNIEYVNPKFTEVTGYTAVEVIGKNPRILKSGKMAQQVYKQLWQKITSGNVWQGEFYNRKKNGELYWEFASISPVRTSGGVIRTFVKVAEDVTERKKAAETIQRMAYYDALTGLPNRVLFNDRLSVAIAHAHRSGEKLGVMFLDLDHFKTINDTLGHTEGDLLLKAVADRLKSYVREEDTFARVGGDEFLLLLPGINCIEDVEKIAHKILNAVGQPFAIGSREHYITTSIGTALCPDNGEDAETLVRNADNAMYHAKEQGRNNCQHFTEALYEKVSKRLILHDRLHQALERNEFVVYYQPKVNVNIGEITSMEALVRWRHPELGLVPPAEFISSAEETGLIVSIGEWVLRTACAQNKAWQDAGLPLLCVSVNLSARQIQGQNITEMVTRVLNETGLAPHYLELEITESIALQVSSTIIASLRELKEMGVRVALDDFGTGVYSLGYLKYLPIDTLKIDKSFVRSISTSVGDRAIVKAIMVLAQGLGLKAVPEGVETEEQFDFFKQLECEEMQGYLFSEPMPAEEFEKALGRSRGTWLGKVRKPGETERGRESGK